MKKSIILLIIAIIAIVLLGIFLFISSKHDFGPNASNEIILSSKTYVNQLEKINISGTNDSVMITEKVKWEVSKHDGGTTISFAIPVPYSFTVDGENQISVSYDNDAEISSEIDGTGKKHIIISVPIEPDKVGGNSADVNGYVALHVEQDGTEWSTVIDVDISDVSIN